MLPDKLRKEIFDEIQSGKTYSEVSKIYHRNKSTIHRIVKSYQTSKRKRGRKPILNKWDRYHMKLEVLKNMKLGIPTISAKIVQDLYLNVSPRTVRRSLNNLDIKYEQVFKKYILTSKQRKDRVMMARSYILDNINWDSVIFSDEKIFTLACNDSYQTWRLKGTNQFKKYGFLKSPGLMIWGAIFPNGLLSFRIISGKINSKKYIEVINSSLIPIINLSKFKYYYFQQDNARVHTSKECQEYFKNSHINVLKWAPYSPDLNIIENIWSNLSTRVYNHGPIKNLKILRQKVTESIYEFNMESKDYVQKLYKSIPKRICDIIEKRGDRVR